MAEQTFEGDENTWFDVFNSIDQLLQNIDKKANDEYISFHEASLILNKLETALSILVSLTTLDIDLTENTRVVLLQLSECLTELHNNWATKIDNMRQVTVTLPNLRVDIVNMSGGRGRPSLCIPNEILEELRNSSYSWTEISKILQVSSWTVHRRVREYNLQHLDRFSDISDNELDQLILGYISRHGDTTGESYLIGFIRSQGIHVQRDRVHSSLTRVDPENTALRWACVITRRVYSVPFDNNIDLFVLHYIYLPRINHALQEFTLAFNNCLMRTENNCSPEKIWTNGMINETVRQLSANDAIENIELYGVDWNGPVPLDNQNILEVEPPNYPFPVEYLHQLQDHVNPLQQSSNYGV